MDKAVYGGSIIIALVLVVGSYLIPNDSIMWLASTSMAMNIGRLIIVALMLGLVFTNPPRRKELRMALGLAAVMFASLAIARALSGTVKVVDALLFLEAAVSFGLAAIEAPVVLPDMAVEQEPATFAGYLETARARRDISLRQRLVFTFFAVQLLYLARYIKPRWIDAIVGQPHGKMAQAHSP